MNIKKILRKFVIKHRLGKIKEHGSNIRISKGCHFQGNIYIGSNVSIGEGAYFVSTRAKLIIGDDVVIAPNVTVYTGDHPIHVVGKNIIDITDSDKEKLGEDFDKDVVVEQGCWIGTRAIILKGVTIGRGSVIGAGTIVTKDVPPYSVLVGVPQQRCFPRFTAEEISEHEKILGMQGETV